MSEDASMTMDFDWPHSPEHRFQGSGVYMVTGATYKKALLFYDQPRLKLLCGELLKCLGKSRWQVHAWAVFPNHYHFVAQTSDEDPRALANWIRDFHSQSARALNLMDAMGARKVWFNYWDTRLTFETSYYARLNYVHQNAVHHGLVKVARDYPWCSAGWFESKATPALKKTVYSYQTSRVNVPDDFGNF